MLELLGDRNERIDQLEQDVQARLQQHLPVARHEGVVRACSQRPGAALSSLTALCPPRSSQDMKHIFHQQLSIAADQLHAAHQQLEQQQQQREAVGPQS